MPDIKKEQERDELHRAIWSIADDLRGSVDGWDFKSYILGFMFYRYISENLTSKDICFFRYAYASKKQEREKLQKIISEGKEPEKSMATDKLQHLYASFITGYSDIPNKNLPVFSMFGNNEIKAFDVDYDRIVFDTYDYLDKIIGFKLSDVFYAAFNEYYEKTNDFRAKRMALLVKYGTEDEKEIWMLKYGFSFEDIEWLEQYIYDIDQEEIKFKEEINMLPEDKMNLISRFI